MLHDYKGTGRTQTPRQKLAGQRNFYLLQIRGAEASLKSVAAQVGADEAFGHIETYLEEMREAVDRWWAEGKDAPQTPQL